MFWLRKAAEKNEVVAQRLVGVMCLKGEGVPINYREALVWLQKAAMRRKNAGCFSAFRMLV
jgi:TPR repeat protein